LLRGLDHQFESLANLLLSSELAEHWWSQRDVEGRVWGVR
jgi:hypothetical protein